MARSGMPAVAVALAVGMWVMAGSPAAADAPPPTPMAVFGTVTTTTGEAVPHGAVQAWVGGRQAGDPLPLAPDGEFGSAGGLDSKLLIPGSSTDGGAPLSFTVNGIAAATSLVACPYGSVTSLVWQSGAICEVTLTVPAGASAAGLNIDAEPPGATAGQPYTQQFTVSGGTGPYTWSLADGSALPAGLTLSSGGLLSGTPIIPGPAAFTVAVTDHSTPPLTAAQPVGLLIAPAGVTVFASTSASTSSSGAPAIAGGAGSPTPQTTATGAGGTGTVLAALYARNPEPAAPPGSTTGGSVFFDVSVSPDSSFQTLTLQQCGLAPGAVLYWWNGGTWTAVSPQSPSGPCITAVLNSTDSSPLVQQLTGTPFTANAASSTASGGGGVSGAGGGGGTTLATPTPSPAGGVGLTGGTLSTPDGSFTLQVASGAVTGSGTLTVTESGTPPSAIPTGLTPVSPVFTLAGATLTSPQAVAIRYDQAAVPGPLCVYAQAGGGGAWTFVPTSVADGLARAWIAGPESLVLLEATQPFSDVPAGHWAKGAIDTLVAAGVAAGFPDGTFRPDAPVSRAQFVKMLDLTLGLSATGGVTAFADVPPDAWYAPFVAAAVHRGLVQGTSATAFSPDAPVSREQAAVFLARALQLTGGTAPNFTDAAQTDAWAQPAVAAAVAAGYVSGFPDGSFRPLDPTTRAQAAALLARAIESRAP